MANIVVTGGAGFIGSHIVDALVNRHRVTVIDNFVTGRRTNLNPKAKLLRMDIRSKQLPQRLQQIRPQVVFHLAAQMNVRASILDPQYDASVNVLGSLNVIQGALMAKAKRFVFSSTGGAIYGDQSTMPIPETILPKPEAPYGIAKFSIEHYLEYFRSRGLSSVNLRYGNVYGPRQNPKGEAGVVSIFAERIAKKQPLVIFGTGRQTRDYVYVADVVRANLKAMQSAATGSINVGTGIETSVTQLAAAIMHISGTHTRVIHKPAINGELQRNAISPRRAKRVLGWSPQVTLQAGLRLTLPSFGLHHG